MRIRAALAADMHDRLAGGPAGIGLAKVQFTSTLRGQTRTPKLADFQAIVLSVGHAADFVVVSQTVAVVCACICACFHP